MRSVRSTAWDIDIAYRFCAVALAGLLPVFFLPLAWATVAQAKLLLICLAVFAGASTWGYLSYREGFQPLPRSDLAIAVLCLAIAYSVSALFSGAGINGFVGGSGDQLTAAAVWLLFAVALLPSLAFSDRASALSSIVRSIAVGGIALFAIQIVHVLMPNLHLGVLSVAATSVFGSWHELGIFAGLALVLSIGAATFEASSRGWRMVFVALSVLAALILVLVNMLDVWWAAGAALVILAGVSILLPQSSRSRSDRRAAPLIVGAIGLLCIICGFASTPIYTHLPHRLQILQVEIRPSWAATFQIGQSQFSGFKSALVGSGPNTFDRAWSRFKPLGVNGTDYWNIDFNAGTGVIPTALATVGVIGVLAWLGVFAVYALTVVRALRERGLDMLTAAALIGAGYLLVFHVLYTASIALTALALLLIGASAVYDAGYQRRYRAEVVHPAIAATAAAAAIVLALSAIYSIRSDLATMFVNRAAAVFAATGDIAAPARYVSDALRIYPQSDAAQRAAVSLGVIEMQELSASGKSDAASIAKLQSTLSATIQHGMAAVRIGSGDYQNWLSVADLYNSLAGEGVPGAYDNAKSAYQSAHEANPNNPIPLLQLAQIAYAQHDPAAALRYVQQGIELKPDLSIGYEIRASIERDQKDYASAEGDALRATSYAQTDASAWDTLGSVYLAEGAFDKAVQALEYAQSLSPQDGQGQYMLGIAYAQTGDSARALALLEPILAANSSNKNLAALVAQLKTGGIATSTAATSTMH